MKTVIRGAAIALLLPALVLAGCGSPKPAARSTPSPPPSRAPAPSTPPPSPTPQPTVAADGTNVRACYDGNCEITVSESLEISLEPRFQIVLMSVSVSSGTLQIVAESDTGTTHCTGTCSMSMGGPTLNVESRSIGDGKSILRISS